MPGDHFYTISAAERDTAYAFLNYVSEGTACHVRATPASGTTPLYRCFNSGNGDHFYTTSAEERDRAVASGYAFEGIQGHVFAGSETSTVPLFRLYNPTNGDHFYTTSQTEANGATYTFGYRSEGVACHVFEAPTAGTLPLHRMVQVQAGGLVATPSPWAILLCKYKTDASEPPAAQGVPPFRAVCDRFFTESNLTYNAVKFFADMSHGKLDLTGSKVFGWYTIDASQTGTNKDGDPIFDKSQNEVIELARKAARDAGVAVDTFVGVVVIMNTATGWAQGSPGRVAMDWRRVDGRSFDGTLGPRAPGGGNGMEAFGQEMGHGYGLDHSRIDGSNVDYLDDWDSMSTLSGTHRVADPDYCARGPGLNAWNMRSRGWVDESRVWKSSAPMTEGFSETLELRPLHHRNLPGWLALELPGVGSHSPYLVEFRVPEMWDAGLPAAVVLVHRFSGAEERGQNYSPGLLGQPMGTHSYIMRANSGSASLGEGDLLEIGDGPFVRVQVLSIDRPSRAATVRVCYSSAARKTPSVKIEVKSVPNSCAASLVEGSVATFALSVDGLQCSQSYSIRWSVEGATPTSGDDQPVFEARLQEASVTIQVHLVFDDGTTLSESSIFHAVSAEQAALEEFMCKLLRERLKPIPWWEWEPDRLRTAIAAMKATRTVPRAIEALEAALHRLRSL